MHKRVHEKRKWMHNTTCMTTKYEWTRAMSEHNMMIEQKKMDTQQHMNEQNPDEWATNE